MISMTWKGVIIEESLDDTSLMNLVRILKTEKTFLENENEKGLLHFHCVEVEQKSEFVEKAKKSIKQGWYMHICKDDTMIVIFRNKTFEFSEHEKEKIADAKSYGISIGILPEQLEIENLIRHPFD